MAEFFCDGSHCWKFFKCLYSEDTERRIGCASEIALYELRDADTVVLERTDSGMVDVARALGLLRRKNIDAVSLD